MYVSRQLTKNFLLDQHEKPLLNNGLNKVINDGETNAVLNLPNINAEVQLNILKAP